MIARSLLRAPPATTLGLALARVLMLAVKSAVTDAHARVLHLGRHGTASRMRARIARWRMREPCAEVPSLAPAISSGGVGFAGHLSTDPRLSAPVLQPGGRGAVAVPGPFPVSPVRGDADAMAADTASLLLRLHVVHDPECSLRSFRAQAQGFTRCRWRSLETRAPCARRPRRSCGYDRSIAPARCAPHARRNCGCKCQPSRPCDR